MENYYRCTQTWFFKTDIRREISKFYEKTTPNNILEIGCFEGLSSVFFANFLDNPKSTLTCVDPFLNIDNNDHEEYLIHNAEMNFDYNISICKNRDKIEVHKITSDEFFKRLFEEKSEDKESNNKTYNFIYIDGCHEPEFITRDMENSFKVLEENGIMWMDDYKGGDGVTIKNTMDSFLEKYKGQYEIIHSGYQLAIRKKSLQQPSFINNFFSTIRAFVYKLYSSLFVSKTIITGRN